jgi:hypothetical protein
MERRRRRRDRSEGVVEWFFAKGRFEGEVFHRVGAAEEQVVGAPVGQRDRVNHAACDWRAACEREADGRRHAGRCRRLCRFQVDTCLVAVVADLGEKTERAAVGGGERPSRDGAERSAADSGDREDADGAAGLLPGGEAELVNSSAWCCCRCPSLATNRRRERGWEFHGELRDRLRGRCGRGR